MLQCETSSTNKLSKSLRSVESFVIIDPSKSPLSPKLFRKVATWRQIEFESLQNFARRFFIGRRRINQRRLKKGANNKHNLISYCETCHFYRCREVVPLNRNLYSVLRFSNGNKRKRSDYSQADPFKMY